MPILGWRVHFTRRRFLMPRTARITLQNLNADAAAEWLDRKGIEDDVPSLISPEGHYDIDLNSYFFLHPAPENTQSAIAYDLASFLTFLWHHRQPLGKRSWRDATPEDRAAYHRWRRVDERGPGVKGSTWGREVATVNSFYQWAVESGFVEQNPILQRPARDRRWRRSPEGALTPAEAPKDGHREDLAWLPPASYRRWRDVGVRGYVPTGLPDQSFRGSNAARNATFCDLMVRTGLRLTEQASLTMFDIPDIDEHRAYAPTRLPAAIAKNGSGRRIYIPATVLREVWDYIRFDRAELVEQARRRGTYDRFPDKLLVENPESAVIAPHTDGGRRRPVETLNPRQRRRLFICGAEGLEPAVLWLNRRGLPVMPGTWQSVFGDANERCRRSDVALRAHPHLLRHSYAVVTLEQLQREHIRELAAMNPAQRTTYEQIFGDPLDWVRRRLGHRSVETTFKYLHTLNELAMETRLALVPDEWAEFGPSAGELIRECSAEQPTGLTADSA
jgi:site-specific recombinase XerD